MERFNTAEDGFTRDDVEAEECTKECKLVEPLKDDEGDRPTAVKLLITFRSADTLFLSKCRCY